MIILAKASLEFHFENVHIKTTSEAIDRQQASSMTLAIVTNNKTINNAETSILKIKVNEEVFLVNVLF